MHTGVMPAIVDAARSRRLGAPPKGFWSLCPSRSACLPCRTTHRHRCAATWVPRKVAAILAHRTQMGSGSILSRSWHPADARRWLGREFFRRADIPGRPGSPCSSSYAHRPPRDSALSLLWWTARAGHLAVPPHRRRHRSHDGVLGCQCCVFPVVDGIPVLHLHPASVAARERIEAGTPELALRAMAGVESEAQAEAVRRGRGIGIVNLQGHRRGARPEFRGRLLPLPLLGSDVRGRRCGGARGGWRRH